jgi:hypothetical protein
MGDGRWEMGDGGWEMEVEVGNGDRLKRRAVNMNKSRKYVKSKCASEELRELEIDA